MNADERWMRRAVTLAGKGLGCVEPNPPVGCVIVRAGRGDGPGTKLGEGWHRQFGGAHAEVEALADARKSGARSSPRGATVYVTLEPCCHFGKTPPCVDALIEAGVGRVVVGRVDPSSKVSGKGIRRLKKAGIEVMVGVLERECRDLIAPWAKREQTGLPWVIAKWAATIDGAIATAGGDSKWISNAQSRRVVHRVRARVDAVVVGIGTVLADDPQLNARGVRVRRIARRVVIDPQLKTPLDSKLVGTADEQPVTIACSVNRLRRGGKRAGELESRGVEVIAIPNLPGAERNVAARSGVRPSLDVEVLLRYLASEHDASNVLLEGGGRTVGRFVAGRQVDELMVFTGPRVLGDGAAVRPVVLADPLQTIGDYEPLRLMGLRRLGDDVLAVYRSPE